MKTDVLELLMFASKHTFRLFLVQVIAMNLLIAKSGSGQNLDDTFVNMELNNASLIEAFNLIEEQTKFTFGYGREIIDSQHKVSLIAQNQSLRLVLDKLSTDAHLNFHRVNRNISVSPVKETLDQTDKQIPDVGKDQSSYNVSGIVRAPDGQPIPGVNVVEKGTANGTVTDVDGNYSITVSSEEAILTYSFIGYRTMDIPVDGQTRIDISMKEDVSTLSAVEIYSTGYQQLPPERATGSFAFVDQELIKRSTSTDIISRLESVTPGLLFDKRGASDATGMDQRNLRIRGVNSIESDNSPLIVVDNFPYEGDINNINPNDVESVTVLRDAAAASIWGARAANGVIVITLKQGKKNQPLSVSFSSNITVGEKPDLHYSPRFISSPDFIGLEEELFNRGYYNSTESNPFKTPLSPVVELLIQERDGLISSEELNDALKQLGQNDVRNEAEKYFYRKSILQQYALNISGGNDKVQHYLSAGYDKNLSNIDGNDLQRITLVSRNTFQPIKPLQLALGINLTNQQQHNNGFRWGQTGTELPYNRFADEVGNWLSVTNTLRSTYLQEMEDQGLMDWQYRPLQEKSLNDISDANTEYRINTGLEYKIVNPLSISLKYQYQQINGLYENLQDKNSFYIRNQVNRFTQEDGSSLFPYGDILTRRANKQVAHSARIQTNYQQKLSNDHMLSALAGMETRQVHSEGYSTEVYGYDDNVLTYENQLDYITWYPTLPRGAARIPLPSTSLSDLTDRYLSYFGNASYTFKNRYVLTGSARYDASNLFGVKTNQKGVPLWSIGSSWTISEEPFYHSSLLSYLRMRATYGSNGNINKSVTAFPTATYGTDRTTSQSMLSLSTPGNPQLRWEKINMINLGVDFASKDDRISGTFEFYNKHGHDIIGEMPLDPTTGAVLSSNLTNKINYAETQTRGFDLQLNTINIDRHFQWSSNILLSYSGNKILKFSNESLRYTTIISGTSLNTSGLPQEGKPIDGLYSIPWFGLEHETGDPLVEIDQELVKDYSTYVRNLTIEDLIYNGVNVAPFYESLRNNFSWKGLSLSVNVSWKTGYYFRRSTLSYTNLFSNWEMHEDYMGRWQNPGDENHSNIPSMPESSDNYRDIVYKNSEVLIEKGDHIRLEDVNIGYTLSQNSSPWLPFKELRVFGYARNLGILWQASKSGLDPDYPNASYRTPRTYSIGLNATF